MSAEVRERVENPLREGLRLARTPDPCAMVIFGATGHLVRKKLMPALYNLALQRLLPASFEVVGAARGASSDAAFRALMHDAVAASSRTQPLHEEVWESFAQHLSYVSLGDGDGYTALRERLAALDASAGTSGNRLFYLALPPSAYAPTVDEIGRYQIARSGRGWSRIVIEKPFGHDLESAQRLSMALYGVFHEPEIFRIDHYLGKETVQNILVLRFANGIFEPLWSRQYVDHVQITVAESIGIEGRADYYDQAGATRDILQNHLLQLLTLVTMEPPISFDADSVRTEKVKALRAVRRLTPAEVARSVVPGQYGPGYIDGQPVPGYRQEEGIPPGSRTETYIALRLNIDNWRWEDIPFYLRTGKRLPKRSTEIAIQFRRAPHQLFGEEGRALEPNLLAIRIQPDEGISLRFAVKAPVSGLRLRTVNMDFSYGASFMTEAPDAYETLLLDALRGEATLFMRRDEVEEQWKIVQPILDAFAASDEPTALYEAGSWGPAAADALMAAEGRTWRRP
jgi:glucose-6-phosphate 1-dehydrogenase